MNEALEAMLAGMREDGGDESCVSVAESDLPKGFQPILDLKTGDKVRVKSEQYNNYRSAENGNILTVFRVGSFPCTNSDDQLYENDFTILLLRPNAISEVAMDSRRFERVTE